MIVTWEHTGVSSEQSFAWLYLGVIIVIPLRQHDTLAYASVDLSEHSFPSYSITFLLSLPCIPYLYISHPSDPCLPLSSNSVRLFCPPLTLPFSIKVILYSLCTLSDKLTKLPPVLLSLSPVWLSCPHCYFRAPLWLWTSLTGLIWNLGQMIARGHST
jgi:hypothetical protein